MEFERETPLHTSPDHDFVTQTEIQQGASTKLLRLSQFGRTSGGDGVPLVCRVGTRMHRCETSSLVGERLGEQRSAFRFPFTRAGLERVGRSEAPVE